MQSLPLVTIVIATRNRKTDVIRALRSCIAQDYPDFEILVFDDASTDGTAEEIESQFPQIRLIVDGRRRGYIVRRNQGFRKALGQYIVSLDDDAYFTSPQTLRQVVHAFGEYPDAAAMALSFVERKADKNHVHPSGAEMSSFVGCAHAIRRDVAIKAGGYREIYVHQGEERDLCIRLMQLGYRIMAVDSAPIAHNVSPLRDRHRLEKYGIRNTLLFTTLNVPHPFLLLRLVIDGIRLIVRKPGWPITFWRAAYLLRAFCSCARYGYLRDPVSLDAYRRFRSLPRHGPRKWAEKPESADSMEAGICSFTHS
ncbi:MAG TPA: glycosyltransferase [Tepidisphaeraceae bacterium]|nr:glycosyltransferase [Tepidisphaeraceae bacterium]